MTEGSALLHEPSGAVSQLALTFVLLNFRFPQPKYRPRISVKQILRRLLKRALLTLSLLVGAGFGSLFLITQAILNHLGKLWQQGNDRNPAI